MGLGGVEVGVHQMELCGMRMREIANGVEGGYEVGL